MQNHVTGQAAARTAAPTQIPAAAARLAELRYTVLDTVNYSPYTTADEKATATRRVAACQNPDVLVKWYCNVLTELSARELAAPAPDALAEAGALAAEHATPAQREEITQLLANRVITRAERTKVRLQVNRLTGPVAVALIGDLYQKVLDRGGMVPPRLLALLPMVPAVRLIA